MKETNKDAFVVTILETIRDCYSLDNGMLIKLREGLNRLSFNNLRALRLLINFSNIGKQ